MSVFLDGPTILLPADLSQFGTADTQADINSSVEYRAWWRWKEEENKAIGLDETLLLLKETLQNRKFDVRLRLFPDMFLASSDGLASGRSWIQVRCACRSCALPHLISKFA